MAHLGTFGIPLVSPELSHEPGRAFVRHLGRMLASPVDLHVFSNYSELCDALAEGRIDFAWLPPIEAHLLSEHAGVHLLLQAVRGGRPWYHGSLFVREDSPIGSLADLEGRSVAFVHRRSAAGFLVPAAHLLSQGVRIAGPPIYLGSHGAVVEAVHAGRVEAGSTYATLVDDLIVDAAWLQVTPPRPMRSLCEVGPVPTDAICAWPGTSRQARADLVGALRALMADPEAARVMSRLFGTDRFADSDRAGYDVIDRAFALLRPPR